MEYKLLNKIEVADLLSIGVHALDRLRKSGGFAKPVMIGKTLRWRDIDVQAWLDQQINEEDR